MVPNAKPFDVARTEIRAGLAADAYDRHKHSSKVYLHIGDLANAIWHTQVALFIHRITRFL